MASCHRNQIVGLVSRALHVSIKKRVEFGAGLQLRALASAGWRQKKPIPAQLSTISRLKLIENIQPPQTVQSDVLKRALEVATIYKTYEGKETGCILLLVNPSDLDEDRVMPLSCNLSSMVGHNLSDDWIEADLRKSFSRDGWMVIDGKTSEILAANSQVAVRKQAGFVLESHGTRHFNALQIAAELECIVVTRSQDGYVTVFSSNEIKKNESARCFRIRDAADDDSASDDQQIQLQRGPAKESTSKSDTFFDRILTWVCGIVGTIGFARAWKKAKERQGKLQVELLEERVRKKQHLEDLKTLLLHCLQTLEEGQDVKELLEGVCQLTDQELSTLVIQLKAEFPSQALDVSKLAYLAMFNTQSLFQR